MRVDRGMDRWKETVKKYELWTDMKRYGKKIEGWTDGKEQGWKM